MHWVRKEASTMMRGSGEVWKSCSRYWRRVLRISSALTFAAVFSAEFAFLGFFSKEFFSMELQERVDGCATGLGVSGGMNVGAAPRSSAWRKRLARTSS